MPASNPRHDDRLMLTIALVIVALLLAQGLLQVLI